VNRFAMFDDFINSPLAFYQGEIYNLPFNMNTFAKMWKITTPEEAKAIIEKQKKEHGVANPTNLEEQAINLVGKDIYDKLIQGYTMKQWGVDPKELPPSIIKRLPVRYTYNNNYFDDRYQGIPRNGYTKMVEAMIKDVELKLNADYFDNKTAYDEMADKIVYTGPIDRFFDYRFGHLDYRSLRFDHESLSTDNYQGNAVVNYTDVLIPYTRIIEHKFFASHHDQAGTIITKEYPASFQETNEPYYPINDEHNTHRYMRYRDHSVACHNILFGGRLAEYRYYDMHHVIRSALDIVNGLLHK
jgi:UDP-galactopyranose mutase